MSSLYAYINKGNMLFMKKKLRMDYKFMFPTIQNKEWDNRAGKIREKSITSKHEENQTKI